MINEKLKQLIAIQKENNETLKEKLKLEHYDVKNVLGSRSLTQYFVNPKKDIVVAFAFTTVRDMYCDYKKEFPLLLDKSLCEKIGYTSISLVRSKEGAELMPCVNYKGEKNIRISRIALGMEGAGKEIQVDHINRQRLCSLSENLRICNNSENSRNKDNATPIRLYNEKWYYELEVTSNQMSLLEKGKFSQVGDKKAKGVIIVNSVPFTSKVDAENSCYEVLQKLYEGTSVKDFIYNIKNDFSRTLNLLIHYYALGDITKEEMYELNLLYWRVDNYEYTLEWYGKLHNMRFYA